MHQIIHAGRRRFGVKSPGPPGNAKVSDGIPLEIVVMRVIRRRLEEEFHAGILVNLASGHTLQGADALLIHLPLQPQAILEQPDAELHSGLVGPVCGPVEAVEPLRFGEPAERDLKHLS